VIAALGAVVDPHRRHPELLRGREISDHVFHHHGGGRLDPELIEQLAIAMALGLGRQIRREDVMEMVDPSADPEAFEHPPRIIGIAIGMDELAAREPGQRCDQPVVPSDPIERDIVHVGHEMLRIHIVMLHQPC